MPAKLNPSTIKAKPPPEVAASERTPAKDAPIIIFMAAISSSACSTIILNLFAYWAIVFIILVEGLMG